MEKVYVQKSRTVAFDVDAMYCFTPRCPDELAVEGGEDIVDELNAGAKKAIKRVASKDAHPANAYWKTEELKELAQPLEGRFANFPNIDLKWFMHGVPGTFGFELIAGLPKPEEYDFLIYKGVERDMHPYGACYHDLGDKISTGVIEWMQVQGMDTVIVGGLATDFCVKLTVLQLLRAGFRVILNLGACRGIAPDSTEKAINEMQDAGAVIVESATQIIAQ